MRRLRRALILLLRLLLGGLLLYAAATKWPAPRAFAEDLANYRLLPASLVPLGAVWVLGFEVVLGAALVLGLWLREAALLVTLLMGVFTAAVASALARGLKIDCGCFGAGASPATASTLVRDLLLLAAAALLFGLSLRGGDGGGPRQRDPGLPAG